MSLLVTRVEPVQRGSMAFAELLHDPHNDLRLGAGGVDDRLPKVPVIRVFDLFFDRNDLDRGRHPSDDVQRELSDLAFGLHEFQFGHADRVGQQLKVFWLSQPRREHGVLTLPHVAQLDAFEPA
ncbi:MAG: hypothetical protein KF779_09085 [Hyphomonadaceae bacterium]|nr:hypothetical protein [Hyphomonadaceae bacterium]